MVVLGRDGEIVGVMLAVNALVLSRDVEGEVVGVTLAVGENEDPDDALDKSV